MSRKILITGSAGHLGRALTKAFLDNGDAVTGADIRAPMDVYIDCDNSIGALCDWAHGRFDIVVCNAKCAKWQVHDALARCAKSAVINIGSIYGAMGPDPAMYVGTEVEETPALYAAAKGAMIALTKHQACTLAPVRSNCIILGGIFRGHSDLFRERYEAKVPLRRMATEQDAVNAVMFLASEKSSYITGACLSVTGGLDAMA